jgi:hypothetical protein
MRTPAGLDFARPAFGGDAGNEALMPVPALSSLAGTRCWFQSLSGSQLTSEKVMSVDPGVNPR